MKKLYLLLLIWIILPIPGYSLTMEEAIQNTITFNNKIKESQNLSQAQKMRVKSTGSAFKPNLDLTYTFNRQEEDTFFATPNTSSINLEATYNLFRGFIDKNSLEKEKHLFEANRYEEKSTLADTILLAKVSYIEILKTAKNLEAAKEGVELLEKQRADSENMFKQGLIAKNELLKVEVELASARFVLLRTKSNLRTARFRLERIMGVKLSPHEAIEDPPTPTRVDFNMETLMPIMLARRSEVNYLKSIVESEKSDRDSIRGKYLPALDLAIDFTKFGDSAFPGGRDDPILPDTELSGTLTFTWNIYSGGSTRYSIKAKEEEIGANEQQLLDLEKELALQLELALEENRITAAQINVSKKSISQAEENYRITKNQYKAGIATATDLLNDRLFLTRAKVEYNNSFYNLMLSISSLERILEVRSIDEVISLLASKYR